MLKMFMKNRDLPIIDFNIFTVDRTRDTPSSIQIKNSSKATNTSSVGRFINVSQTDTSAGNIRLANKSV